MGRTCVAALALAGVAYAGDGNVGSRTAITIFAAPPPSTATYGGVTYGGYTPPSGAMITERRGVDIAASGEVRITGVAATIDPASVQLRSLTDPAVVVTEQRFAPGAKTPDEILERHVGDTITVVTPKGEVSGVLRSADAQALVIEIGAGDQRHLQVMRRDGYVQDVRLPAGTTIDKPSLVWRLSTKHPGKHDVEITYRADGMSWSADYLAILDDAGKTIDFSAWATVKNATGASYDDAELTLVSGGPSVAPAATNPYVMSPQRPTTPPSRFVVPAAVHLGSGESVQVELMKPRVAAKARPVVTFEAMPDLSPSFQAYPGTDCNQVNPGTGRAEVAVEVDVPSTGPLPDGRVRMFKRKGDRLELVSEDQLRSSAGLARMRLSPDNEIAGDRHAVSCATDEHTRTIREKLEIKVENHGKQATDVVVREFLWRYPMWRIDPADESIPGTRGGPQTQEYRLNVPAGGKKSVTYTVVYTW